MYINLGNTIDSTRKQINLQYVAAAAGLALAVSSAVAVGNWQIDGSASSQANSSRAGVNSVRQEDETPHVVFYLVASQAQADAAAAFEVQVEIDRAGSSAPAAPRVAHVLPAGTSAQESVAQDLINEASLNAAGVYVSTVDLRDR